MRSESDFSKNHIWYIIKDGEESPIPWDDLNLEYDLGIVKPETLVWSTGMKKWIPVKEVIQLEKNFIKIPNYRSSNTEDSFLMQNETGSLRVFQKPVSHELKSRKKSLNPWIVMTSLVVIMAFVFFSRKSPHSILESQLSPSDYQSLNEKKDLIAAIKGNGLKPKYHVFLSLPDQTEIIVTLKGVKNTLINQAYYQKAQSLIIRNGHAITDAFENYDQGNLPLGEYELSVVEKNSNRLIKKRNYFLAGQKNQAYQNQLNVFLGKISEQLKSELSDLSQYLDLVESQFNSSIELFHSFMTSNKIDHNHGEWNEFHKNWLVMENEIIKNLNQQNMALLDLLVDLQKAEKSLFDLHLVQDVYITSGKTDEVLKTRIYENEKLIQSRLIEIRRKLAQIQL